jgi:hypothetical protein
MTQNNDDSQPVGFGKPPKATQFKKGQSGNPKGRPKGKPNMATVILRTTQVKVPINEKGRRREVTKFEVAMMQLSNKAAGGDLRALDLMTRLRQMAEDRLDQNQSQKPGPEDTDRLLLEDLFQRLAPTSEGGNPDESEPERKDD